MAGKPSPSGMRCYRGGVADSKVYSVQRVCMGLSNPSHSRVIRATYARRFWVEENFSQAFFCHCLGRGKFQAKLFFAMVSGNAAGVGDVGGAQCPPPLVWGLWQAAGGDRAPASDAGEG